MKRQKPMNLDTRWWLTDPGIRSLSLETRGIWFEILLLMHESSERGKLLLNGHPMPETTLAYILRLDGESMEMAIGALLDAGVAAREPDTTILYCPRMVAEGVKPVRKVAP